VTENTLLERRGGRPTDIFTGFTKSILSFIDDPQGARIELSEDPPDSLPGQALAAGSRNR